jgi:hypothetical protein
MINAVQAQINHTVATYNIAYAALQALNPDGSWQMEHHLHELHPKDNCSPTPQADKVECKVAEMQQKNCQAQIVAATAAGCPLPNFDHASDPLVSQPTTTSMSSGRYEPS